MFERIRAKTGQKKPKKAKKERFTVSVHPLFVLFGVYFFLRGELFLFLTFTVVAIIHECGHAFYAARIGCRLETLRLLPCGAVVSGDIEGISLSDEIKLALAGPAVNAACAVLFVALWWLFPDTYPYTDTAAYASAGLAAVNLLPAYPLDGGRAVYCIAAKRRGESFARKLALVISFSAAAAPLALFVYSCFVRVNFTVLFFAAFIVFGALDKKNSRYRRIRCDYSADMKRGMEIKKIALSADCTVKKALSFLERGKYLEITVFDAAGGFVCELSEAEFCAILERADIYSPLAAYLGGEEGGTEGGFL